MTKTSLFTAWLLLGSCLPLYGKRAAAKSVPTEDLAAYVSRMQQQQIVLVPLSPGSLWTDNGRFAGIAPDYKAARTGDLITIVVSQSLNAQSANNVSTNRTFNASSGITALAGQLKTAGVQNLFSPTSAQALTGKSQAATTSTLVTNLAGRVAAVLPNGVLVIEAERVMTMNNEKQTLLIRGLVRPGDIAPDNSISSNQIASLELELKGKGVLSDGTRPPNPVVRWILRIVGF